jgi:uncharacterized protein (DUF3084 family)
MFAKKPRLNPICPFLAFSKPLRFCRVAIIFITLLSLIGCTTTKQGGRTLTREERLKKDQRATVVQGHTAGTIIGAGLGAGLGFGAGLLLAMMTKNEQQRRAIVAAATIAGASAGARLGYVKGGEWGQRVARKKAEYASTEQYLTACIDDARRLRVKAEQENARLRMQVHGMKQKLASERMSAKQRKAEMLKVNNERQTLQSRAQRLDLEVRAQRQILAETGDRQKTQSERAALSSEIGKLEVEKQKLQQWSTELAQLGNRFAG